MQQCAHNENIYRNRGACKGLWLLLPKAGNFHRDQTVGPSRAAAMNPAAAVLRLGVTVAVHSDMPVSLIDPPLTMWCAANHITSSGKSHCR